MDYAALSNHVIAAGLLNRRYGYYALKIFYTLAVLFGLLWLFVAADSFFVRFLLTILLAFAFIQAGLLGHDSAHLAIFRSRLLNELAGLVFFGFLTGIGYNHWVWRHNAHHANPNHENEDPDSGTVAQSVEELRTKVGLSGFVYRRQDFLFPIIFANSVNYYQMYALFYNFRMKPSFLKWADLFMMGLHFVLFWVAPFFLMAWWQAALLVACLRFLMGLYFGAISATNHKGMRLIRSGERLSFIERQVLTTRNVKASAVVDFVYGGLNYQIEHHLFSTMPRANFGKCQVLVKKFCVENKIPYEEVGVLSSYFDIIRSLRKVVLEYRLQKRSNSQSPAA